MKAGNEECKKRNWKEQNWELGRMLHVGLTDSHVHEGLCNGAVVGHVVMFWHHRSTPPVEA